MTNNEHIPDMEQVQKCGGVKLKSNFLIISLFRKQYSWIFRLNKFQDS